MRTKHFQRTSSGLVCAIICWIQLAAFALSGVDESSLHRLAKASSLSYLDMIRMASSSYLKTSKLEPVIQVVDAGSQSGATIFRSPDDAEGGKHKLVVACRGSANLNNFATNLNFNLVPATQLSQNFVPSNALVHEGFQMASLGLWRELSKPLRKHLDASTTEVISFKENPTLSIVTFGGPRLCNSVLASYLRNEALIGCKIENLVHTKDPVLANNQRLWDNLGFESVGTELECDPYSPTVFTAVKGAPKYPFAWNIVDHCNYMVSCIKRS